MSYFKNFPNLQYVNRFPDSQSNDETTIAKNIFKRAKIREDLASSFALFEYYSIGDNERPDQIAEKLYGNPEYDWIILVANNIINLYDQWPLSQSQFNEYLNKKYGSEEALEQIHHYETLELKDSYGRIVLPAGLIVDEAFYNSPTYKPVTGELPGITFPPLYLSPIVAIATAYRGLTIDDEYKVTNVSIANSGRGYKTTPTVIFSPPPTTENALAQPVIVDYRVSSIVGLNSGKGYRVPPSIIIDPPPESVQASAQSQLGSDGDSDKVASTFITNPGVGYGLTSPPISFSLPPHIVLGALYQDQSSNSIGNQVDGMYVKSDGLKVFTTSGTGSFLISSYTLSSAWDVSNVTLVSQFNASAQFSYCTGIDFSPDGTRMYVSGGKSGTFFIARYNLTSPWDLTTAFYASQTLVSSPGGIRFKPDGTKMYNLKSSSPDSIEEYTLTNPWDITSKVYVKSYNIETLTGDNEILGFSFNSDGTKLYVCGVNSGAIFEFDLESWNLSTIKYSSSLYVGDRISNPSDVFISSDTYDILICGGVNDRLFKYRGYSRTRGISILENSSLKQIIVTNAGIGYTIAPQITIGSPYPAVGAAITTILTPSGGYISSFVITNPGFGYTTTPIIKIDKAPNYSTASGIASVVNERIVSITIKDGGDNYYTAPTITFSEQPQQVLNLYVGQTYSQVNKIWRWNGSTWEERITEPYSFLDGNTIKSAEGPLIAMPVSVYEYEQKINESKRLIFIPKKEYIPTIIRDLKAIMKYDIESDDVVDSDLKSTYNPKYTGV